MQSTARERQKDKRIFYHQLIHSPNNWDGQIWEKPELQMTPCPVWQASMCSWAIFCWLPRLISRKQDQKQSNQDSNRCTGTGCWNCKWQLSSLGRTQCSPHLFKIRDGEEEGRRKVGNERKSCPSTGSLSQCLQQPEIAQSEVQSNSLIVGGRHPTTQAIASCLPGSARARSWNQEWSLHRKPGLWHRTVASQVASFNC